MPAHGQAGSDAAPAPSCGPPETRPLAMPGTEDAEAEQRQGREHDRHRVVDGRRRAATEARGELENSVEPMPMMTASTST